MQLFYLPQLSLSDADVLLNAEDSHHAQRVLRLREGEDVMLTNGNGLGAMGRIDGLENRLVRIHIESTEQYAPPQAQLSMAVCPTKNHDRYEWFVEKAMEIGLTQLIPLITIHSERKTVQRARLERLLVAALKQSQAYYMPELTTEATFNDLISADYDGQKFIAWCGDAGAQPLQHLIKKGLSARILIGPEGDFDPAEVAAALDAGYRPVRLGNKRLRTETAALAACHIFNLINES